jgi:Pyoverdine/dityrosine biosynthesis protein
MELTECHATMLAALRRCTKRGSPVELTVLAFPFKVPNPAKVGARRLPDFAEFAAIRHLRTLRDAIRSVYPPGLELHILHDGSLIADVIGIEPWEVQQYENYFKRLVEMAGASDFIRCYDFGTLQQRSALNPLDAMDRLRSKAEQWWRLQQGTAEWRCRFRKTFGMLNLRNLPQTSIVSLFHHAGLGRLPPGWEQLERQVHGAMIEYHIKDAIIHGFDPRPCCFPDAIHATTQDRPGRLSIWMLRRGRSLLPWHGVGCLDNRGRAQIAHAIQVCDRADCCPISVADEDSPFVYRIGTPPPGSFGAMQK